MSPQIATLKFNIADGKNGLIYTASLFLRLGHTVISLLRSHLQQCQKRNRKIRNKRETELRPKELTEISLHCSEKR